MSTAHRADTATAAPLHEHSWQELTSSHQTKLKPFTKQPKYGMTDISPDILLLFNSNRFKLCSKISHLAAILNDRRLGNIT